MRLRPRSRPLPGLAGHKPVNGRPGGLDEGPQDGQPGIYHLKEWARWSHPQRVGWLRVNMVSEYAADMRIRLLAAEILRKARVRDRDYPAMAAALLRWTQRNIQYTEEYDEQIQSPWVTLETRTGDCDDIAVLLATLAASINLFCRFVLAGSDPKSGQLVRWVEGSGPPNKKHTFFHIYCEFSWPATGPVVFASAEPTFAAAPLGYDLVFHGVQVDAHGRPSVPPNVAREGRDGIMWSALRSPNLVNGRPKPGTTRVVKGPLSAGGRGPIGNLGSYGAIPTSFARIPHPYGQTPVDLEEEKKKAEVEATKARPVRQLASGTWWQGVAVEAVSAGIVAGVVLAVTEYLRRSYFDQRRR